MPGSNLAWHQLFPLMFDVAFLGARGIFQKNISIKADSYYGACHVAIRSWSSIQHCVCFKRVYPSNVLKAR
jgi:hypothetical protein